MRSLLRKKPIADWEFGWHKECGSQKPTPTKEPPGRWTAADPRWENQEHKITTALLPRRKTAAGQTCSPLFFKFKFTYCCFTLPYSLSSAPYFINYYYWGVVAMPGSAQGYSSLCVQRLSLAVCNSSNEQGSTALQGKCFTPVLCLQPLVP